MEKMYKLPKHFTGYNAEKIELVFFKSLCYSLQGLGVVTVKEICGYSYPKNYYCAMISDSENQFTIYMNCFCPVIGFGEITDSLEKYYDKPNVVQALKSLDPGISVVCASDLGQEVCETNTLDLADHEIKELNFWLPTTIGRLLFSWYFD